MATTTGLLGGAMVGNPYLDAQMYHQAREEMIRQQSYAAMANRSMQQNCAGAQEAPQANLVLLLLGDANA